MSSDDEARRIDDMMATILSRRLAKPDRRRRTPTPPRTPERRRGTCPYCFQPGHHLTVNHCLRALERPPPKPSP